MIVTTTKKLAKETKSLFRELPYNGFNVFGVTETKITNFNIPLDFDPSIPNYNFEYVPTPLSAGGGGMYICLLYTSPSPRDQRGSRMPSSA